MKKIEFCVKIHDFFNQNCFVRFCLNFEKNDEKIPKSENLKIFEYAYKISF